MGFLSNNDLRARADEFDISESICFLRLVTYVIVLVLQKPGCRSEHHQWHHYFKVKNQKRDNSQKNKGGLDILPGNYANNQVVHVRYVVH